MASDAGGRCPSRRLLTQDFEQRRRAREIAQSRRRSSTRRRTSRGTARSGNMPFRCLWILRWAGDDGADFLFELDILCEVDTSDERIELFLRECNWLFSGQLSGTIGVRLELATEIVVKVDPFDEQVEVFLRPGRDDL